MTEEQKKWHEEAAQNYESNVRAFQVDSSTDLGIYSDKEIDFFKNAMPNRQIVICTGQPIPNGYVIVQLVTNFGCPDDKAWVIKIPGQQETVCTNSPIPSGYVIIQQVTNFGCPGDRAWVIKIPGQQETVCTNSPIPNGYVIVQQVTNFGCPGDRGYIIKRL